MIKAAAAPALEELTFYIGRAYYNYKLLLERLLADVGLDRHVRPGMGHILFALFDEEDVIIRDIVERTKLAAPTITVILKEMEREGLVERRRDAEDGRSVRVRLTPLGRSLEPRRRSALRRMQGVLQRGLSPREADRTRRSLARMIESMREEMSGG